MGNLHFHPLTLNVCYPVEHQHEIPEMQNIYFYQETKIIKFKIGK